MQRKPFTPPYKARRIQRERVSDCDVLIRAGCERRTFGFHDIVQLREGETSLDETFRAMRTSLPKGR